MIKVDNLSFTYKKTHKLAISNVNFHIKEGEIFGFLGPSGAGKTTTQRLIIGLLRGYEGNIEVLGGERNNLGNEFFEDVGVAFDFPNMYLKLTAKENLDLIKSYYKNECLDTEELLDRVGLLPDKDKKVEGYSKGMKMRLNFIRALIHDPKLLFFDEPTSGLDPVNAKIVKDMILDLKKRGKTVFLTTHDMTVAEQLCDRVALIVDGQIKVIDTPKNLMFNNGEKKVKVEYFEENTLIYKEFKLDSIHSNDEFFKIMSTKKIKTIHSAEATLEDVFIKLTGRVLQ